MGELARRTGFAVVAITEAGFLIWQGGIAFALTLSVCAAIAAWEFFRLAGHDGVRAFAVGGVPLAALIPIIVHTNMVGITLVPVGAAGALAVLAIFATAVWRRTNERPLSAVAATVFGVVYTGGLLSFGYALRYHRFVVDAAGGTALVGLPLVVTWATDTGAYAVGKAIGRRKLMPAVSPGKTVAGAIGGLVVAVVAASLYVPYVLRTWGHLSLTPAGIVLFGAIVSVTAQVGDLAESLLKREAGVKDTSKIIPGHGGVLDRLDSLLFVLPVSYVLLTEMLVVAP